MENTIIEIIGAILVLFGSIFLFLGALVAELAKPFVKMKQLI